MLDLPMPVALLLRRATNAKSPKEHHDAAYFAWEVSLRLNLAARPPADPAVVVRGTVGQWVGAARVPDATYTAPGLVDVFALFSEHGLEKKSRPKSVTARKVLDALPAYRNRVIGHGSVRAGSFYDAGGAALIEGLKAAWVNAVFWSEGSELVYVEGIAIDAEGQRRARVFVLTGTMSEMEDYRGTTGLGSEVLPGRLYVRRTGGYRPLDPWLLYESGEVAERVWFLSGLGRSPSYLDYASGETLKGRVLAERFPRVGAAVTALVGGAATDKAEKEEPAAGAETPYPGYAVVGELASSERGAVYLARQEGLGRLVALKALSPEVARDARARRRFERETAALALSDHPNVVKIHASGEGPGGLYYAMEYLDGADLGRVAVALGSYEDLDEAIAHATAAARASHAAVLRGAPDASVVLEEKPARGARQGRYRGLAKLMREAALGLHHLHEQGVLHRAVRPDNLMVTAGERRLVVMDLGRALTGDGGGTRTATALGLMETLRYTAPEQLGKGAPDRRADVYALGAVFHELVTGQPLHAAESEAGWIASLLGEDARAADAVDARVPRTLARILARTTAREPGARPDTAAVLADELEAYLAEPEVVATVAVATVVGDAPTRSGEGTVSTSGAPALGDKSVLLELDPEGKLRGVGLRDLGEATAPPLARQSGDGKYRTVGSIGEGGMGKVYLVEDRDLKRQVALKVARASGGAASERFVAEAQVMGQLEHPNIVPLHDIGLSEDQKPYYTMRYVKGRTLKDVLDDLRSGDTATRKEYSLARLVQVFLQVAQAVDYAHARGVVHRDLKPANVVLGGHGEVQVLDWGLAMVVDAGGVETHLTRADAYQGRAVGTPGYMSPEQARGESVDGRSDVYALGVILYELLTLRRPFEGASAEVLAAVLSEEVEAPSRVVKGRLVPRELERACVKALARAVENRQRSAGDLIGEVQTWLEAESDREKRHELAEEKAAEGREKLEEYHRMQEEVTRLEAQAQEVSERFEPWQPAEDKTEVIDARHSLRDAELRLTRTATDVVGAYTEALGFESENASARQGLADYYWDRFSGAEERGDERGARYYSELVEQYHDGQYARELDGTGSLSLGSEPSEAEVWLHELVEDGFVLREGEGRQVGTTPLGPLPLGMGSYVAVLTKEGYRDVRYPVSITRNREWTGTVKLYTDVEIGEGFVYVPGGPFVCGGDAEALRSLPRGEPVVEDFFLARHPVTMAEYLEYLNAVAVREGLAAAAGRGPRPAPEVPTYLVTADGRLALPGVDADGDEWFPEMPVLGVSWGDAMAYCAWRSGREGVTYRLPEELEWEKAARGVDGRWYPWGWHFDPSLCNMTESRRERPAAVPVEEFPSDVSVYGVRGLAGNIQDWTSTEHTEGTGSRRRVQRVFRGGCWSYVARDSRAANRYWLGPTRCHDDLGFRLARSPLGSVTI